MNISSDDLVAMVSFPGLDHPQPVAARLLKVRVMNESLPAALVNVDKIAPDDRKRMIEDFWQRLGPIVFPQIWGTEALVSAAASQERRSRSAEGVSLGKVEQIPFQFDGSVSPQVHSGDSEVRASVLDGFMSNFWRPDAARTRQIDFPSLHFGGGQILPPPRYKNVDSYQQHFRQREKKLDTAGAYHFSPLLERRLLCAYPDEAGLDDAAEEMMNQLCHWMIRWTGKPFQWQPVPYTDLSAAVDELSAEAASATVVFVMNKEPGIYTEAALRLPSSKIKRIRQRTLSQQYQNLVNGAKTRGNVPDKAKGKRAWDTFVKMTAMDLFEAMDGVPFCIDAAGRFDAQLVIDVAHDRRSYALSLLVARVEGKQLDFLLRSDVTTKPDVKHEAINGIHLRDDIVRNLLLWMGKRKASLKSLLIARDGKLCQAEGAAIQAAMKKLQQDGVVAPDAHIVLAELHKNTEMHLRLWEVNADATVTNVLEGTAVSLSPTTEVFVTTGAGTLTQGTAAPMLIVCPDETAATGMTTDATDSLAASAHLNWAKPSVAQRLSLPFKRTDDVLQEWAAREIRRIQ